MGVDRVGGLLVVAVSCAAQSSTVQCRAVEVRGEVSYDIYIVSDTTTKYILLKYSMYSECHQKKEGLGYRTEVQYNIGFVSLFCLDLQ